MKSVIHNIETENKTGRSERGKGTENFVVGRLLGQFVNQNFPGYLCHFRLLCRTFIRCRETFWRRSSISAVVRHSHTL